MLLSHGQELFKLTMPVSPLLPPSAMIRAEHPDDAELPSKTRCERFMCAQPWWADGFAAHRHFQFRNRSALPITIRSETPIAAAHRIGLKNPSAASGTLRAL